MSVNRLSVLSFLAFLTTLAPGVRAQGSDNCATPTLIAGTGTFACNNGSATSGTQGQNETLCDLAGTTSIDRDIWFRWVAPSTGGLTLSLCAGGSLDTKIAVYPGTGCPANGTALACDDDDCGFASTSTVYLNVVSGQSYVFQIGMFPGAAGTITSFNLNLGPSFPPPLSCTSAGPDVVVGQLIDTFDANPVGSIDALAIGTYSCNIGTAELNWVQGNNNHPVIGQNLYRYKVVNGAGRFEQIGMSWLKHGFTALQDTLCCPTCTDSGTGSRLGVGCADPYTAQLNAAQSGLGPHWEVNAHTGVFTYPFTSPAFAGSIARRLQVAVADLEVTGGVGAAQYFGEGHYVAKDDATAGNQDNNASHRAITVSGGPTNFSFALAGTTFRAQSAIEAWPSVDSGATLVTTHFPSEGKLIVGGNATALGGGQWHYEYAVYNMNSDRSVGSVAIPVPNGVTVTNVGFHDVPYHDGDGPGSVNFSGVDWPSVVAGGFVTWTTQTFASNASANAIRWGTTYNFRFDANVAPQTGDVTLGGFKTVGSHVVNGLPVPGVPPAAFEAFCAGDGTLTDHTTPCPCGNNGAPGNGCGHSFDPNGSNLSASGAPALDTVVLHAQFEPASSFTLFMQHENSGDAVFHDGVLCASNPLIRLRGRAAVGGEAFFPNSLFAQDSTTTLSQRGGVFPGQGVRRYYAAWYRNASSTFCPPATANVTNGWKIDW